MFAACSSTPADPPADPIFIALPSDFQPYASWTSFYVGDATTLDGVDLPGPRTVYINQMPPPGSTQFPVGTILVKVVQTDPPPTSWQMFGMVKRGGGFDQAGAPGWEWFGLNITAQDTVAIVWRGDGPPPDGGYGGLPGNLSCVFCHVAAVANDYVQTPQLQLDKL